MTILTDQYSLDLAALPVRAEKLMIRFGMQIVNGKKNMLLIHPAAESGFEPLYVRFASGIALKLDDGTSAQGHGQLVVTGQRIIGLITGGSVGKIKLDSSVGSVYSFTLSLDDIQPLTIKTNWRNKPVEVVVRSRTGQDPAFLLQVYALHVAVTNDGEINYTSLSDFLQRVTPEGRQRLQGK